MKKKLKSILILSIIVAGLFYAVYYVTLTENSYEYTSTDVIEKVKPQSTEEELKAKMINDKIEKMLKDSEFQKEVRKMAESRVYLDLAQESQKNTTHYLEKSREATLVREKLEWDNNQRNLDRVVLQELEKEIKEEN